MEKYRSGFKKKSEEYEGCKEPIFFLGGGGVGRWGGFWKVVFGGGCLFWFLFWKVVWFLEWKREDFVEVYEPVFLSGFLSWIGETPGQLEVKNGFVYLLLVDFWPTKAPILGIMFLFFYRLLEGKI